MVVYLFVLDIENLFRGMGNGLGGVEVVMSMEEIPQGALGNLGNLASGNAGNLGGIGGPAGQPGIVDGAGKCIFHKHVTSK